MADLKRMTRRQLLLFHAEAERARCERQAETLESLALAFTGNGAGVARKLRERLD